MTKIEKLKDLIKDSHKIVFFSGAGVSTASGIPDFRGNGGLYTQKGNISPETILSGSFFYNNTEQFYEYYKTKMLYPSVQPNIVHKKVAEWEKDNKLLAVITQNIDNLHHKAGSKKVIELHGNVNKNYCVRCGKNYDLDYLINSKKIPLCDCGHIIKPYVVLYGEALDGEVIWAAEQAVQQADTLIIAGTSLTVYPAASLIYLFQGKNLVVINKTPTSADSIADLVINEDLTDIFNKL